MVTKLSEILRVIDNMITEKSDTSQNIIIGVSWMVACWKTWTCKNIIRHIDDVYKREVFYFPFDFWINYKSLWSDKYFEKFHLDDFEFAIECIRNGKDWFYPRYDLYKKWKHKNIKIGSQFFIWNNKILRNIVWNLQDTSTDKHFYCEEQDSIFTFRPAKNGIHLIEGTLILRNVRTKSSYDVLLSIESRWEERVSRIFRRYNIQETFWGNTRTEQDFVQFLMDEARDCADVEIKNQMDGSVIHYNNTSCSVTGLLDLFYLLEKISNLSPEVCVKRFWFTSRELEKFIDEKIEHTGNSPCRKELSEQLVFLQLNKHLIRLSNIDIILDRLSVLI